MHGRLKCEVIFLRALTLQRSDLLIAEPVLATTVRTLPGNSVAGHPPQVFLHAVLANAKTAATAPAKGELIAAAVTAVNSAFWATPSIDAFFNSGIHDLLHIPLFRSFPPLNLYSLSLGHGHGKRLSASHGQVKKVSVHKSQINLIQG